MKKYLVEYVSPRQPAILAQEFCLGLERLDRILEKRLRQGYVCRIKLVGGTPESPGREAKKYWYMVWNASRRVGVGISTQKILEADGWYLYFQGHSERGGHARQNSNKRLAEAGL